MAVQKKLKANSGPNHHLWKGDAATVACKRGRAQRLYDISICEMCGVKARDRHHIDGNTGNNAPGNIQILCRRCHMVVDGRRDKFILERGKRVTKREACVICEAPFAPLRKGRCRNCSNFFYRHRTERPIDTRAGAKCKPETPCPVCGRPTARKTKGRCCTCYNYWKYNGRDKTPDFKFKLSPEAVSAIRQLLKDGVTHREIASRLGINRSTVTRISAGHTYREVAIFPTA